MVRDEQIRLLYENTAISVAITVPVAAVLSYLQWNVIPHGIVLGWLGFMLAISAVRFLLGRLYASLPDLQSMRAWGIEFFIGVWLAAAGWGITAVILYPEAYLTNQLYLAFVLGGMMVGAASVLAARIEAFAVFIALTGLPISLRLFFGADDAHVALGPLAVIYTVTTLIIAWRIHVTIASSLQLRFENQDLLANLRAEIGERRRAADAMEKSERRLELALFGADLGLWDRNLQTGEVFWDQRWAAMLGYRLDELKLSLETWEELIHPADRAKMQLSLDEHLAGRQPFYQSEYRMRTKSGEWKWIRSRGKVAARDGRAQPVRVTGTHRDVTEDKETEDALRQSHEALETRVEERTADLNKAVVLLREEIAERQRAERERSSMEAHLQNAQKLEALGLLARGIAHDFNNILTSIMGYAQLAVDDLAMESPVRRHLAQVVKAGERAADLVRRLLVFSGKNDESVKPVEIGPLVIEALELLRASIPSSIDLRHAIHPRCGFVLANPALIHQVIMNLCTNAYQAMQGSVGCLEVTLVPIEADDAHSPALGGLAQGPCVKLTVSDTGPGISAEIAERVFEPFFTTKEVGRGTGLGLSMVHGAVSRCGGLVTFESQPGRGTSFYVYLPRVGAGQPPAEQPLPPAPRGAERILLVDDEQSVVELGSRILEELGYVITTEISSPAALDRFASNADSFDLVISDVTMPKMTGGELVAKIKAIRPDIPAILISGFHDEPAPTGEGGAADIVERVKKPFTRSDLALAIRRALDRRSAHQT